MLLTPASFSVAQTATLRPPVGVPPDSQHFNGKWYRVYLEKVGWKRAREKCAALHGQLAIVPDEPTHAFLKQLANGLHLWLGATDEKIEGLWVWVDGTPMKFTAWAENSPDNANKNEHYLEMHSVGKWNDNRENASDVVGYICEWKGK